MPSLLNEFRTEFREQVLDMLWRQWNSLGVAGHDPSTRDHILDLEGLLAVSSSLGRHDQRLFDEVMDWLKLNGWLVNVTRLKRILKTESFSGGRVLSAIAAHLSRGAEALKWKQVATNVPTSVETEPLFFRDDGVAVPVLGTIEPIFASYGWARSPLRLRGYSQTFRPTESATLILQLRALLGINARCEVIAYLLTHDDAHPSQVARSAYYFERAVQGAMMDMSRSGVIQVRTLGREKRYWLDASHWRSLLKREGTRREKWMTWPPLYAALEKVWLSLEDPKLMTSSDALVASEFRRLMLEIRPMLERAGVATLLTNDQLHRGESYLPVFVADIRRLLDFAGG